MKKPQRLRDVMAEDPALRRFCDRLGAQDFPTAAEVAEAQHTLSQDRAERQPELPLQGAA